MAAGSPRRALAGSLRSIIPPRPWATACSLFISLRIFPAVNHCWWGWSGSDGIQLPTGILAVICGTISPSPYRGWINPPNKEKNQDVQRLFPWIGELCGNLYKAWKAILFPLPLTAWALNPPPAMKVRLHWLGQSLLAWHHLKAPSCSSSWLPGKPFRPGACFPTSKMSFPALCTVRTPEFSHHCSLGGSCQDSVS